MRLKMLGTAAVLALALVACGDDDDSASSGATTATTGGGGGQTVEIAAEGIAWDKGTYTAEAGEVTLHITNKDSVEHTLILRETDLPKMEAGPKDEASESTTLEAGSYEFYCDVPGHSNMVATLEVS